MATYNATTVKALAYDLACDMIAAGIQPKTFGPKSQLAKTFNVTVNKRGTHVSISAHNVEWLDSSGEHFDQSMSLTPSNTFEETIYAVVNGAFAQITVLVDWERHCD